MPELAAPVEVRFDHHRPGTTALGIGTATPRISWQIPAAPDDYIQTSYEIEINGTARFTVASAEQIRCLGQARPSRPEKQLPYA
jgi:alpha-L-rhamnosidase